MSRSTPSHKDFDSGARAIRSSGLTDISLGMEAKPDFSLFRAATNLEDTALEVIRPIVLGEGAVVVTGYENLLSVLAMAMSIRPGLSYADRSALRIVLTEQTRPAGRVAHAARLTADRLTAHFLRPGGVYIPDPRDFRAIGAREALASGAIMVRIVSPEKLGGTRDDTPEGVQANMVVGEDFAALSTGGFSRRDLLDRAIVMDRVASDGAAFGARRDAAEAFWSAGNPCNREVTRILDEMLKPIGMREAVAVAVGTTLSYPPFTGADKRHQVQSDLVSQALARVYENGFAFVSVPAGAGQSDVQDEIERRLSGNAARMIGGGTLPQGLWAAHVETSTGGRWSEEKISGIFSEAAPLALDGTVAQIDGESLVQAAYRRMKCRYVPQGGAGGGSDYAGFPEIRQEAIEVSLTKAQIAAWDQMRDEIARAIAGALDKQSQAHLEHLQRICDQSPEAALFAWKQGGMSSRVRTTAKGSATQDSEQNTLPMFMGAEMDDADGQDVIGDALSSRALRGLDKVRMKLVVGLAERSGQLLCLVEDDLARHALARRAAEVSEAPVLAVVSEASMRTAGVPSRDASYQRAESADVAMSILSGIEVGPSIIFAAADQAAEMTLPEATTAVILSAPEDIDRVAASLSAVDGLGKRSGFISCMTLEDGLVRGVAGRDEAGSPSKRVALAAAQMRARVSEARDGVADVMNDLRLRLGDDIRAPEQGRCHLTVMESKDAFSIFMIAGTSEEADQAAMPPRLIAICRDPATGEEIVRRNQVGCAEFLSGLAWPEPVEDPRVHPELPSLEVIDVIGRHMSHLTHWDARPERLVGLLDCLAAFVSKGESCGEEVFSDLCLVSLEIIGRKWADHLTKSRVLGRVSEPGLEKALRALEDRPIWEIDEIREEMVQLINWRIVEDASRPKTLHERVVAVIHGTGDADLAV